MGYYREDVVSVDEWQNDVLYCTVLYLCTVLTTVFSATRMHCQLAYANCHCEQLYSTHTLCMNAAVDFSFALASAAAPHRTAQHSTAQHSTVHMHICTTSHSQKDGRHIATRVHRTTVATVERGKEKEG